MLSGVVRIEILSRVELVDYLKSRRQLIGYVVIGVPSAVRSCQVEEDHLEMMEEMAFRFQFHLYDNANHLS